MAEPVNTIVERALRDMALEAPRAYAATSRCLDGLCLSAQFEDVLFLEASGGQLQRSTTERVADIRMRSTRDVLLALIGGQQTLSAAMRSGEIELEGKLETLGRGLLAAEYFIGGLLRMKSAASLLAALRGME